MIKKLWIIIKNYQLKQKLKKINYGENVHFGYDIVFAYPENIFIENNSYINGGWLFAGPNSKIIIGKNTLISWNVHIRTTTHNYKYKSQLIIEQGHKESNIIIGNDVWIGFGAQIMGGVTVGDGVVVGAGAIVTKDVDPYTVVAGVPAVSIGKRN